MLGITVLGLSFVHSPGRAEILMYKTWLQVFTDIAGVKSLESTFLALCS